MSTENEKSGREISSVQFPYVDLEDSINIARAMHDAGGVPMDRDQLAAALGISPVGGNFAIKLSSARMFGLIASAQGRYELTELGFEILDPSRERAAKAAAFLNVELYRKTYENFKGRHIPPRPHGLENAFVQFGVSSKQKDKARHVFDRSARFAGFFPNGNEDRLVQPVIGNVALSSASQQAVEQEPPALHSPAPQVAPAIATGQSLHPFIQGLLSELPEPRSDWAMEDRAKWLQAAAQIFDLIYSGGRGRISIGSDG